MKEPVVADSACLIGLERIGQLDLLPALFEPVFIPPAVAAEIGFRRPWLRLVTPTDQALVATLAGTVDAGESEAIALGRECGYRTLLDDRRARLAARRLGLPMLGVVGILLRAKAAGLVPRIRPLLEALEANDFYLAVALREEVLRIADE